jgi:translation initiation factor IF-1
VSGQRDERRRPGRISSILEDKLFTVRLEDGREVTAHIGAEMRIYEVRLLEGDRVAVELSPFDPSRGRIVRRV